MAAEPFGGTLVLATTAKTLQVLLQEAGETVPQRATASLLQLRAWPDNTGDAYLGGAAVAVGRRMALIQAGEGQMVSVPSTLVLGHLYLRGEAGGEKVDLLAVCL